VSYVPKAEAEEPGKARGPADSSRSSAAEDAELVRRAQAGEIGGYEELVRRHQRRVLAIVASVLAAKEDVEDVAQQVFIKVFLSLKRFDGRSAFSTWLYKVTTNECWDYLRRKRARPLVYQADLAEDQLQRLEAARHGDHNPGATLDAQRRAEIRDLLEQLLGELGREERMMLLLKEVEGFSLEEIGKVLGLNTNTAKVRLFRARRRLMELYRKRVSGKIPSGRARDPER